MTQLSTKPAAGRLQLGLRRYLSAGFLALNSLVVPRRLRAFVRAREFSLVLLAAAIGAIGGSVMAAMGALVDGLHMLFFGLSPGQRLSAQFALEPSRAVLVPVLG